MPHPFTVAGFKGQAYGSMSYVVLEDMIVLFCGHHIELKMASLVEVSKIC